MLRMIRGCRVPDPGALEEGFEQKDRSFYANLHAEHIDRAMRAFLLRQKEELFFFLELPTPQKEERNCARNGKGRTGMERRPFTGMCITGMGSRRRLHSPCWMRMASF